MGHTRSERERKEVFGVFYACERAKDEIQASFVLFLPWPIPAREREGKKDRHEKHHEFSEMSSHLVVVCLSFG